MQKQNTAQRGMYSALLAQAVSEAQRDLATRFSSRLTGLSRISVSQNLIVPRLSSY
jgi:hypothetical protein